ncbi:hypothetical protein CPB84DRAFT_1838626 [Gymnopilus junonius]|uniref:Glutathione synthetase n=1 Tax=Gymnopilus junonius TaxID=109634 RepID=A0A9P5NAK6_GYMJU|nr:hypothetical protein CPB84DRAFT_1838626 [Gymnopilus junonius]
MSSNFDFASWPPSLTKVQLEELTLHATTFALSHGLLYLPPAERQPTIPSAAIHAPISLFPSPFPRELFWNARRIQRIYNVLYSRIAMDDGFLDRVMGAEQGVGRVDDFTGQLWTGWKKLRDEGLAQPLHLGLFRSDYLLHAPPNETLSIKQVEFNTISVSFGCLSQKISELHRYLSAATNYYMTSPYLTRDNFPPNETISGLANGLAEAHKAYNVPGSQILFVVQPGERNVFDQRALEYELLEKQVPLISRPEDTHPAKFVEISTVYYDQDICLMNIPPQRTIPPVFLERSKAIKSPTIALQLAGGKKVQEQISRNMARMYLALKINELRQSFIAIYVNSRCSSIKTGQEGFGVCKARKSAMSLVLKPQREGGGNNVYKEAIPSFLDNLPPQEREAWIAMELIKPPDGTGNYLVKAGSTDLQDQMPIKTDVVSELGIFGCKDSNEGGVATGFSVLDSLLLVD